MMIGVIQIILSESILIRLHQRTQAAGQGNLGQRNLRLRFVTWPRNTNSIIGRACLWMAANSYGTIFGIVIILGAPIWSVKLSGVGLARLLMILKNYLSPINPRLL